MFESGRGSRDPESGQATVRGLTLDVTAQREALAAKSASREAELEGQRLESLGLLAGGVAHDFNNMLTAVMGQAELCRLELPPEHPITARLARIERSARGAADLARQLLDFSGKGRFRLGNLDVNEVVVEILGLLSATLRRRVHLRMELCEDPHPILADRSQLQQVFMNLLLNAADSMNDAGGNVTVRTSMVQLSSEELTSLLGDQESLPGGYAAVEIVDDGVGMEPGAIDRVFNPFFTTKDSGHGLGLSVVLGVVRGHGGRIGVVSEPGRGTTFTVYLPLTDGGFDQEPGAPESRRAARSARILVVDDQAEVREVIQAMLEHGGYEATLADGGRAGLACLEEADGDFDLLMLDLTMPDMSGEAVLAEVSRRWPDLQVLLISGYSEEEATARLVARGGVGFLQKPLRVTTLLQTVESFVGRSE